MPAYSFDSRIEEDKPTVLELQAEHIAKYVVEQLGGSRSSNEIIGLDNNEILNAIRKSNPNVGNCDIKRVRHEKHDRFTSIYITVTTTQKEIKLVEKVFHSDDKELYGYNLLSQYTLAIPQIYCLDFEKKIILVEDCSDYIQGFHFDEDSVSSDNKNSY